MWSIRSIEFREHILDFSTSGGGQHPSTALFADGIQLINALELVDFSPERTQLIICEQCGTVHCKSGDWVKFARIENSIILVPAFREMEMGKWERQEYSPPDLILKRGVPFLDHNLSTRLLGELNRYRKVDITDIEMLSSQQLCRAMQWEAPAHVMGRYPDRPSLHISQLLYSEPIELERTISLVNELIEEIKGSDRKLRLEQTAKEIKFYIDSPSVLQWSPVAITERGNTQVRIDDRHSVVLE